MYFSHPFDLTGSGLGLRRTMLPALQVEVPGCIDFFEVSPENWVGVDGHLGKQFRNLTERHRFVALGLGRPGPARHSVFKRTEAVSQLSRFRAEHRALELL